MKPKGKLDKVVSSSSLVRTSGFHPGNRGSNPLETTTARNSGLFFIFAVMKTHILISPQWNPYLNLAVETYITDTQDADVMTMYLWRNEQTVVIGVNQNPFSECNVDVLSSEGGHLMRRRTGGGAVYHDLGNLNFSFITGKKNYDVGKQLSVIQAALRHFGLESEISGRNDITWEGRKFSGNAFFKGTRNNLHHGTILIKTDGEKMQRYLNVDKAKLQKNGVKSVSSRVINLSEVASITSDNIIKPLTDAFETIYGNKAAVLDFNALANIDEVKEIRSKIESSNYLFGRWKDFHAVKKARFAWGGVEIDLDVDSAEKRIRDITIATDCLDTEIIGQAERLIKGSSIVTPPANENGNPIIDDIISMIYDD